MTNKKPIRIGIIAAAHGIRGEVKLRSNAQPPEAIFAYGPLSDASGKRFTFTKHGGNEKGFIAGVDGVTDRNAAELLKGTELFVAAAALPKKKNNQWYAHELVGLEARLADGKIYGIVAQLYNFGAGDIVEIELPKGKTEMLPFVPPFVGDVYVDKGYMIVSPPEYVEGKE